MAGSINSNVPGWEDVPLTALLEEWTGLPAAIDNDANAMAYCGMAFTEPAMEGSMSSASLSAPALEVD